MIQLDYSQLQCPHPVVETRKQILATPDEILSVLVGDQTAKENVIRLAEKMGYLTSWETEGPNYRLTLTPDSPQQQKAPQTILATVRGNVVIFCASDQMGSGDLEFGQVLLKNFFVTLLELDSLPDLILFVNSGVKLVCAGSEALEALNSLACRGVDIASCGLCLDYYNLKEKLKVGRVTNMLEIAEAQMQAHRIIRL
ncbi:sulfurtransferase-like selenium metabolism protein YedF [Malonomonas rubra]|uniref:sulfurtransferase-like selenium metabolism protein YedF n=1 Tax=Malonomonas rubra TaxID=57040 RepID=UPI0026EA601F|nr:sulfurtransferase-like selenium metabolism protein YedF [Malonomonas rubra]